MTARDLVIILLEKGFELICLQLREMYQFVCRHVLLVTDPHVWPTCSLQAGAEQTGPAVKVLLPVGLALYELVTLYLLQFLKAQVKFQQRPGSDNL